MISLPKFYQCPKKFQARQDTIISIYRELFSDKVPAGEQYWTMCGPHSDNGVLPDGSELKQLIDSGLITVEQFHGVDIDKETIEMNMKAEQRANWFNQDIYDAMNEYYDKGQLNPAIVYADYISMKQYGCSKTTELLHLLNDLDKKNILLVCNIMLNNPHERGMSFRKTIKEDSEKILAEFESNSLFQFVWHGGKWEMYPKYYVYKGTGKRSRTVMGTVVFYKS